MADIINLGCDILTGINKAGKLQCDSDGWYLNMVLGAFDVPNSSGNTYPLSAAKRFFEEDSPLMRKSRKGCLFGEEGHPQQTPGMSKMDYFRRLCWIDPKNISHAMRNLRLSEINDPISGKRIMAVLSDILPTRERGQYLKKELDTPDVNVAFSLRSLTNDVPRPDLRTDKYIKMLICYDWVTEGGIQYSHKYNSPGLEEFGDNVVKLIQPKGVSETSFTEKEIRAAIHQEERHLKMTGTESSAILTEMKEVLIDVPGTDGTGAVRIPAARWIK